MKLNNLFTLLAIMGMIMHVGDSIAMLSQGGKLPRPFTRVKTTKVVDQIKKNGDIILNLPLNASSYEVLNVTKDAPFLEIKEKYENLIKTFDVKSATAMQHGFSKEQTKAIVTRVNNAYQSINESIKEIKRSAAEQQRQAAQKEWLETTKQSEVKNYIPTEKDCKEGERLTKWIDVIREGAYDWFNVFTIALLFHEEYKRVIQAINSLDADHKELSDAIHLCRDTHTTLFVEEDKLKNLAKNREIIKSTRSFIKVFMGLEGVLNWIKEEKEFIEKLRKKREELPIKEEIQVRATVGKQDENQSTITMQNDYDYVLRLKKQGKKIKNLNQASNYLKYYFMIKFFFNRSDYRDYQIINRNIQLLSKIHDHIVSAINSYNEHQKIWEGRYDVQFTVYIDVIQHLDEYRDEIQELIKKAGTSSSSKALLRINDVLQWIDDEKKLIDELNKVRKGFL